MLAPEPERGKTTTVLGGLYGGGGAAVSGVAGFFLGARLEWVNAVDEVGGDALSMIPALKWLVEHEDQSPAASLGAWVLGVGVVSAAVGLPMVLVAVCGGTVVLRFWDHALERKRDC